LTLRWRLVKRPPDIEAGDGGAENDPKAWLEKRETRFFAKALEIKGISRMSGVALRSHPAERSSLPFPPA
jgi:hypothetical protein